MSNCVVEAAQKYLDGSIPRYVVTNNRVQSGDHFPHDSDDDDLRFLSGRREALIEDFEHRIVAARRYGCHVENSSDWCTATPDAADAFELTAVEIVRRNSNNRSHLLVVHLPELGQQGEEREGQARNQRRASR